MERAVAIKRLGQILGKHMGYRVDPTAPTRDERANALANLKPAIAERDRLSEEKRARAEWLLANDREYQSLKANYEGAKTHADKLGQTSRHFKITVGVVWSGFFEVRAEGDSWEEVIEKINRRPAAAA